VLNYLDPPYFLLVSGLFVSLSSGLAFNTTLKQAINEWAKTRSTRILSNLQGLQLLIPFLGIAGGISLFLTAGLVIFGFPLWMSAAISLVLTAATSALIWSQLGKMLVLLSQGGSQALDLDTLEARE
jgi:hypothetical protein